MGDIISRKQLLSFFIQDSYLLDKYYSIKENMNFEELLLEELDQKIETQRNNQKFSHLISLLILSKDYLIDLNQYDKAIMYLIECLSFLEEVDSYNILRIYVDVELGYLYELNECYQEAEEYYTKALNLSIERENTLLISYTFEKLYQLMLKSCDYNSFLKFKLLIEKYDYTYLSSSTRLIFDALSLYVNKDYAGVIEILSNDKKIKQNKEVFKITHILKTQSYYKLNRIKEIRWMAFNESNDLLIETPYLLFYKLTYQFIYHPNELDDYIDNLSSLLSNKQRYGLLTLVYRYLLTEQLVLSHRDLYFKVHDLLVKNHQKISCKENLLKTNIQNSYLIYKYYYRQLNSIHFDQKYRILTWQQMSDYYQREYTNQTVVVFLKMDNCFYDEFTNQLKECLIQQLNGVIQSDITFSFHNQGIWFYFKSCTGQFKLKQKLNSLLNPLYEVLKKKYTVVFCLPRDTSPEFLETVQRVYNSFYSLMIDNNFDEKYNASFGRLTYNSFDLSEKIRNLLLKAYQDNYFMLDKIPFYQQDERNLFGIEVKGILKKLNLITHQLQGDKTIIKEMVLREIEMMTLELGCQFLKDGYSSLTSQPYLIVKLSRETLMNQLILEHILSCIKRYNLNYEQVIISIDEDVLFEQNKCLKYLVSRLHEFNIGVALDNYGMGSLTGSIRNIRINYLKLSSKLIHYLNSSNQDLGMMKSLLSVCSTYNVKIFCSDIENQSSYDLISNFDIDVVGGSYYKRKFVV